MPPKGSKKRKLAPSSSATTTNGNTTNAHTDYPPPLDRETWPGWVEMESEPAFFNVMLSEMGVQGTKVREVYDMDEAFLLMLPQPVHALIFLFRYKEDAQQQKLNSCPKELWFANQTPDFACATFALLNIVNNIPGLHLGTELQNFRDFTMDMDPLSRGDAIDSFDFVKRIHNSFARENDILQADMHMKGKAAKFRKRQAVAKANATKAAKKAEMASPNRPLQEKAPNATRVSRRAKRPTSRKSPKESTPDADPDDEYDTPKSAKVTSVPDEDEDPVSNGLRRSKREPKPRKLGLVSAAEPDPQDEEGFHFVAYMPINGNVWKLDGLERFPQIVGPFSEDGPGWMHIAKPHLVGRMEQYAASEIQFNLMAIVHDPIISERVALINNIRTLQATDKRLDNILEDWRAMEGAETKKEVILTHSPELGISAEDVEAPVQYTNGDHASALDTTVETKVKDDDDLLRLMTRRQEVIMQQSGLRAGVRDSLEAAKDDEEKARHRRHDYGSFVRGWLGELAEQEVLNALME